MMTGDYLERVYAGVLGKMIGVYLGRPFEGWTYEQISATLGEITGYVHAQLDKPLIVTDDDLTGTFTFLRALPDHDFPADLSPAQIGQTWLNYIIENRTILWWGGVGHSTEHTAYLRLKAGVPAPRSGSIALNGRITAEQIGSQIFIDGWGMVAPGDPERAADLARRAASVSHDGEGIYGAQVVAALAAQAFVERDLAVLLDTAVGLIPSDSTVRRLIDDIREWHQREPDWRRARSLLAARYGYDTFGGNCHIIPNHGLIMLSLLYGQDDLRRTLMIVNTSGWDTDCNSGNVGCLLGIKNGLAGLATVPDLRHPLDDRLYLPTADGGRAITDAVQETYAIANAGRALQQLLPLMPKNGARFHFSLPGSVQTFRVRDAAAPAMTVENVPLGDGRCLALHYRLPPDQPGFAGADTFIPPDAVAMPGYELLAAPTLYPGQTVRGRVLAASTNPQAVQVGLYLRHYGAGDALVLVRGPGQTLAPGGEQQLTWDMPLLGCDPIAEIGVWVRSPTAAAGTLYLDYLTWEGAPQVHWERPAHDGTMWHRAWVDGLDHCFTDFAELFRLAQDRGRGLLMTGTREWCSVAVCATLTVPMARRLGLAVRVQGLQRYFALLVDRHGRVELVRVLDGETVLASAAVTWDGDEPLRLRLQMVDNVLQGWVNAVRVDAAVDSDGGLSGGGVGLVVEEGCVFVHGVQVLPGAEVRVLNC